MRDRKAWPTVLILSLIAVVCDASGTGTPQCFRDLVVGEAGYSVEGTYAFNAIVNDRPSYAHVEDIGPVSLWDVHYESGRWVLSSTMGLGVCYANDSDAPTPPAAGWYTAAGIPPAPSMSGGEACPPAALLISESGGTTLVTEAGAIDSFEVSLSEEPGADVWLAWSDSGQAYVSGSPPEEFLYSWSRRPTADWWTRPLLFDVGAVDDAVGEGDHVATILLSTKSDDPRFDGLTAALAVHITDNDVRESVLRIIPMGGSSQSILDAVLALAEGERAPVIGSQPLAAQYAIGTPICGGCAILNANGRISHSGRLSVSLYRLTLDGNDEFLELVFEASYRYDGAEGCHRFCIPTEGVTPGYYDVYVLFPDGTDSVIRVEILPPDDPA